MKNRTFSDVERLGLAAMLLEVAGASTAFEGFVEFRTVPVVGPISVGKGKSNKRSTYERTPRRAKA